MSPYIRKAISTVRRLQSRRLVPWVPDYQIAESLKCDREELNVRLSRWSVEHPGVIDRRKVDVLCCYRLV